VLDIRLLRIDRASKVPIYHQLCEILRARILRGEWKPGDMIPTESELMAEYSVSRTVLRQALDTLVNEGLIYRQQGRGTFVSHPTLEQAMTHIISFTEDMLRRGFSPGTQVLVSGLIPAPADIAERLGVCPGEQLARIKRLRLADGEPLSIEDAHFVHRYCPGILNADYASTSLRRTLETQYGIRLVSAKQTIRAVAASSEIAALLAIPAHAPLLFIERVSAMQQGVPFEFLRISYRGDRYTLYNELSG
jgi:GntR family transcriptional regulator